MDDFTDQASAIALNMRPEARIMSHQLRLKIYQDWRAKMMERIFSGSPFSDKNPPPEPVHHKVECDEATCICELEIRLELYEQVFMQYLSSSHFKKRGSGDEAESPDTYPDHIEGDEFVFEFPEFLGLDPLRERVQS